MRQSTILRTLLLIIGGMNQLGLYLAAIIDNPDWRGLSYPLDTIGRHGEPSDDRCTETIALYSRYSSLRCLANSKKGRKRSMGSGKTVVVLFSADSSRMVCRYRSWIAAG